MKKKRKRSNIFLVLIFLVGLSLLLYPSFSNYWNSFHATQAIGNYVEQVASMSKEEYDHIYQEAVTYNEELAQQGIGCQLNDAQRSRYESLLNIGGSGIIGYIEIESLQVNLPIYHGTDDSILQIATGHVDWTSLPVGGTSSHCVISGHRGLPSAKLFTHLDELREGDTFTLNVLDKVLTYEVDQILIVEPKDVSNLQIVKGEDYCTLVTCTPYAINTHRLLVRGHRIENSEKSVAHITAEAIQVEQLLVASIMAIPLLVLTLIFVFVAGKRDS